MLTLWWGYYETSTMTWLLVSSVLQSGEERCGWMDEQFTVVPSFSPLLQPLWTSVLCMARDWYWDNMSVCMSLFQLSYMQQVYLWTFKLFLFNRFLHHNVYFNWYGHQKVLKLLYDGNCWATTIVAPVFLHVTPFMRLCASVSHSDGPSSCCVVYLMAAC